MVVIEKRIKEELSIKKKIMIFCILMTLIFLIYFWGVTEGSFSKIYRGANEFLKTIDCAKIIDEYGVETTYVIEFEIKAKKAGKVLVYFQNGTTAKYDFGQYIDVDTEYQKKVLQICPTLVNEEVEEAFLAFYGEYDSGVIPSVRKIKFYVKE